MSSKLAKWYYTVGLFTLNANTTSVSPPCVRRIDIYFGAISRGPGLWLLRLLRPDNLEPWEPENTPVWRPGAAGMSNNHRHTQALDGKPWTPCFDSQAGAAVWNPSPVPVTNSVIPFIWYKSKRSGTSLWVTLSRFRVCIIHFLTSEFPPCHCLV